MLRPRLGRSSRHLPIIGWRLAPFSSPVIENGQIVGMVALGDLAVQNQYANEAEQALQSISTPSVPQQ